MIQWQWVLFEQLSVNELYEIIKVRQEIFVVEQNCVYLDADGLDQFSWHLLGWKGGADKRKIVAYLRVVFPRKKYAEPSIGRVLTTLALRGTGLGKELMQRTLIHVADVYPDSPIRISAQQYLEKFYANFGFQVVSEPYDEDGIVHIEMLRNER